MDPLSLMEDSGLNGSDGSNSSEGFVHEVSWTGARLQRVITLSILMVLSFTGNALIILVLACSKTNRTFSRVNIFILNLAIGDLCIALITILSELIFEIYGEWILGNIGCKTVMPAQILTLSSTTYILVAMSKDRYQAICRPLDFNPSTSRARKSVILAWTAAFISAIPYVFIFEHAERGTHLDGSPYYFCLSIGYTADWQKKLNFVWLSLSVLILPALWVGFCYCSLARVVWQQANCHQNGDGLRKTTGARRISRAKIKTLKMSLTIILSFVLCWTPYFAVYNILIFTDYTYEIPESVVVLADTLALMNSAVNPIIYGFFNMRIKLGIIESCSCLKPEKACPRRLSEPSSSSTGVRLELRRTTYRGRLNMVDASPRHIFKKRTHFNQNRFQHTTNHLRALSSNTNFSIRPIYTQTCSFSPSSANFERKHICYKSP